MGGYYININIRTDDAEAVRREVVHAFADEGFALVRDDQASQVADNDDLLPDDDDWYGVIVSGAVEPGWTTVYVEDWADSGLLTRLLSKALDAPALELWVADDIHWGYNYSESGRIVDRFADNPASVASSPEEAELYIGDAAALGHILQTTPEALQKALADARLAAGKFAGSAIDGLCEAVGLPFDHVFTGYEYFLTDDPEDYAQDLEDWPQFRHLIFRHPEKRERLEE